MKINDLWANDNLTEGFIYLEITEINPIIGAEIIWEGPINDPKNIRLQFSKDDDIVQVKIPGKKKAWTYKYNTIQEAKEAGQEALGALLVLYFHELVQKLYSIDTKYFPPERQ